MKKFIIRALIIMSVTAVYITVNAQSAIKAKVVTFSMPGAAGTYITCANDSGDFGGYYLDGANPKGFYFDAKLNDTFDIVYPGATQTWVYGINNFKQMVGAYNNTGAIANNEGFKFTKATNTYEDLTTSWLSSMDITIARDINNQGCVVGDYKQSTTHECFTMCNGTNVPQIHYNYNPTYIFGNNNANKAVGLWMVGSTHNGFIRDFAGNFSFLNYPGATKTSPNAINDSNVVVGTFNTTRSFIYKHGVYREIKKDAVTDFRVQDINNSGMIVGFYADGGGVNRGFYMPVCDIGFRPDTNGWRFRNEDVNMWPEAWYNQFVYDKDPYLGAPMQFPKITYNNGNVDTCPRRVFPDWPLFVSVYGEEQCYFVLGPFKLLKQSSFEKWRSTIKEWGGSCFGFTQTAFMAWDSIQRFKAKYPNVGPWNPVSNPRNDLYHLPINNANRLCINGMQIMQSQKDYGRQRTKNYDNMSPRMTLDTLKKLMNLEKTYQYGIVFRNQNPGGGGHIVNPYKIEIDTINPDLEYIYVYDNNQPGDTTRKVTVKKSNNSWNYHLSVNAGVGEDPWGGINAHKGLYIIWPADSFYRKPNVDSVKYVGIAQAEKNAFFDIYNSSTSNIFISNNQQQSIGCNNNLVFNTIPNASPNIDINGTSSLPIGYLLPEDSYNVLMKDFSNGLVQLSLFLDENIYAFTRGGALLNQNDNFTISTDGVVYSNNDNVSKVIRVNTVTQSGTAEKTFTLSEMPLHQNAAIAFSVLNNDKLKVKNEGPATHYHLYMQILSQAGVGMFEYDSIAIDQNTTHIIAMNWANVQNADLEIYVDNANNGINDDTLFFNNQGIPVLIAAPNNIQVTPPAISDTLFITNIGSGSMPWTVTSDATSWLTVSGSNNGSNYGYIKYNCTANSGAERTGHLTVNAPGATGSPFIVEVKQAGVLAVPANLSASDGTFSNGVNLSWDALPGATHYKVYRSSYAGSYGSPLTGWITGTSYVDNTALGGNFYFYSVKAAQSATGTNESGFSNIDDGWKACFTADFVINGACLGLPTVFQNMSSVHTTAHYLWDIDNNGTIDYTGTNISHVFSTPGTKTIKLTVTDSVLCTDFIVKTVTIQSFPTLNLPDSVEICQNQSVTLNAGAGFSSYLWSSGQNAQSVNIDSTGFGLGSHAIYVSVTNTGGCAAIDTTVITWDICIDAPTPQSSSFAVTIYPNPARDLLNIDIEQGGGYMGLEMYNFNGQLVYSENIPETGSKYNTTINVGSMGRGIYFVRFINRDKVELRKIVLY